MKARVEQSEYWHYIELTPETIEEAAVLASLTVNTKREPAAITCYFTSNFVTGVQFDNVSYNNKKHGLDSKTKIY
jgi:hypothetical protein